MGYWLIVNVVLLALFGWSWWYVQHAAGDDFGAVFPAVILGAVGGVSWLGYLMTALWLHRFF